jgi:hypothetical protein
MPRFRQLLAWVQLPRQILLHADAAVVLGALDYTKSKATPTL